MHVGEALLQRAVEAAERQRGEELGRVAAAPGRRQQARHAVGGDLRLARQAGAVRDDEFRELEPAAREPIVDRGFARGGRGRQAVLLGADREHQRPRHHVAGELVGDAHDVGQRLRLVRQQQSRRGRRRRAQRAAAELAAQFAPERHEGAERVLRGVHDREPLCPRRAGLREPAADDHAAGIGRRYRVADAPVAADAAALGEHHAVLHHESLRERLHADLDAAAVVRRPDREFRGLPVHEHGVGQHVVGAPGPAVEVLRALVGRHEARLVDDDVALDHAQPGLAQVRGQPPPSLDGQQRITAALQVEVALQHAALHRRVGPDARLPGIGRPQHVERGPSRHQLHGRGRRPRDRGIDLDQALAGRDVAHDDADVGLGHLLLGEHRARARGQLGGEPRRGGDQCDREGGGHAQRHLVQY